MIRDRLQLRRGGRGGSTAPRGARPRDVCPDEDEDRPCDICDRGKAVYRSREARANICENCYARLVREQNGQEGVQ